MKRFGCAHLIDEPVLKIDGKAKPHTIQSIAVLGAMSSLTDNEKSDMQTSYKLNVGLSHHLEYRGFLPLLQYWSQIFVWM